MSGTNYRPSPSPKSRLDGLKIIFRALPKSNHKEGELGHLVFPEGRHPDLAEFILGEANLWGLEPVFDPLHLIENHSHEIMSFFLECLDEKQVSELRSKLRENLKLPLKKSYTGANWRLLWSSYQVHLQPVFSQLESPLSDQLNNLAWSWSQLIKIMYYPVHSPKVTVWFRYFS